MATVAVAAVAAAAKGSAFRQGPCSNDTASHHSTIDLQSTACGGASALLCVLNTHVAQSHTAALTPKAETVGMPNKLSVPQRAWALLVPMHGLAAA